jgi:NAD(P)H-hydrate epimerase
MNPREVKVLDANSVYHGVTEEQLMENAGKALAECILQRYETNKCVIFCGPGNNGGDGFVAARYLFEKCEVAIVLLGAVRSALARKNFRRVKKCGISIYSFEDERVPKLVEECEVVVDAMLGVGIHGELREPYTYAVEMLNNTNAAVISVDVPTGFRTAVAVTPSLTMTFHEKKDGMDEKNSGEIVEQDIGIPQEAEQFVGLGEMVYYPLPEKESHKGENGVVLTIGGGPYTGAPFLSALAALRAGADLSFLLTPEKIWRIAASFSPDLIVKPLEGEFLSERHIRGIARFIERADAVVIGPGVGEREESREACGKVIEQGFHMGKKIVVDADAIVALKETEGKGDVIVTPHAKEFYELTGVMLPAHIDDRISAAMKQAETLNATILLKGVPDIITDGSNVKLNTIHNEAMTVGGTGDVLAGICGAMLSKGVIPFNAARMAVFINGMAGNYAFERKSYGMTASDVVEMIPHVLKNFLPHK